MMLKFARFDMKIELTSSSVATLEVPDHHLFARVVQSLLSELGECADESYFLFEGEKTVAPKGKLLIINTLPELPLHDRSFEKKLFEKLDVELKSGGNLAAASEMVEGLAADINKSLRKLSLGLWGTYEFSLDWNLPIYLKAFGFGLDADDGLSLLEKCIRFFGLCVDIGFRKPLVFVNTKSFFDSKETKTLFEQVIFHGLTVLNLESHVDNVTYSNEMKYMLDMGFSDT